MPTFSLNRTRLLSGALLALWASGAQAQPAQPQQAKPPEPITVHPQIAPAEPVGADKGKAGTAEPVAPVAGDVATIAPIGGAAQTAGAAQAADPAALRSSLVLSQLLDGGKSVDELFRNGDLTPEVARYILSERVGAWGTVDGHWVEGVRRDLAGLVWRECGEALHKQAVAPQVLPRYLRLWLADYLSNAGDEQVLAVGEQVLKDTPLPLSGDDGQGDKPLVFQTIERMARYMAARGKHAESAQMWERLPSFYAPKERWIADAMIEAGRAYEEAGQSSESKAAYNQAIAVGNDDLASGALWEYANHLIRQGQADAAQQLVLQFEPKAPEAPGRKGPIAASLLGYLHYLKGEWKEARQSYELCLVRRAQLATPKQQEDVRDIAANAQKMLQLIGQWEAHPLVSDPERIDIAVGQEAPDAPITRRFLVSMFREVPLKLSSSNAQIQLAVEDSPWATDSQPLQFEKQIVVSIPPSLLQQETTADIVVSSPQLPKYLLHIPLKITKAHE